MLRLRSDSYGFALPAVLAMIIVLSLVAYATLLQANNGLNLSYKQSYLQMARVASKSAVDYAQEQFDSALCGNYNGTPETNVVQNSRYRVTMKTEVLSTSADGYEKKVKGTGAVYLPKNSATAKYVFDVRSEILRTYATCKTPLDFGPVLWLDASDTSTLKKTVVSTSSITPVPTTGSGVLDLLLPNDTVEEKASDGTQGLLSWLSTDLEMHTCDGLEFAILLCSTVGQRDLNIGIIFQNINIPKNSTISSANIQFVGATPSGAGGPVTHRVKGIYKSSTNPHIDMFTSLGTNQVRTPLNTANLHTSAYSDVSTNNLPPGNVVNFNVTNIAQEMVNNPNWDPADNGGRMGFAISRVSGNGTRRTLKDGIKLSITYSSSSVNQANNGDGLSEWNDKSGNNNTARFAYGTEPTRQDNQINGKTVVRFNNGTMLSALNTAMANKREMTVFTILKPAFSTSASNGRVITGMSSTGTNDTSGSNGIIPAYRNGSTSGFSSNYSGSSAANRTDMTCGASCDNRPYVLSSIFGINSSNRILATLRGEGETQATKDNLSPAASPGPYTFSINQLYLGGRRQGSMAGGTGADYFNGDYAEIVVYDKLLTCRQIESLEDYFRGKWALAASAYTSTCPADIVPIL